MKDTHVCEQCNNTFETQLDLERHIEILHLIPESTNESQLSQCKKCDFSTASHSDMNVHFQFNHKSVKIDINEKDQQIVACMNCEYRCKLNIQLRNHIKKKHSPEWRYTCENCKHLGTFYYRTP